jgi:hypothetical protein
MANELRNYLLLRSAGDPEFYEPPQGNVGIDRDLQLVLAEFMNPENEPEDLLAGLESLIERRKEVERYNRSTEGMLQDALNGYMGFR